ncbi:MAG: acyl-CoA desaturase [Actinomycetota bacterium]|nr:acyl-CoA desaturase [Actinomycetota bacterium]
METLERPASPATARSEYAALSQSVRQAGLLEHRPGYYVLKLTSNVALLGAGIAAFVYLGDSWWQLVVAAYLAFVFAQIGFIGHDAGHRQVAKSRRVNDLIGLLCANLITGFSYSWWLNKHNRHHAHTNLVDRDPDIGAGALVFTADQGRARQGVARIISRYQAALFFPLLFLEAPNLHVASVRALRQERRPGWIGESVLLSIHGLALVGGAFWLLSPVKAVVFLIVQQGLFGFYLGITFATNHTGMPILAEADELGFLRRQVLTSRNITGGRRLTGFIFGGLDLQIEHHLFPAMPRANLRRARRLILPFCRSQGVAYSETTVTRAYRDILRHLHTVGSGRRSPSCPA